MSIFQIKSRNNPADENLVYVLIKHCPDGYALEQLCEQNVHQTTAQFELWE